MTTRPRSSRSRMLAGVLDVQRRQDGMDLHPPGRRDASTAAGRWTPRPRRSRSIGTIETQAYGSYIWGTCTDVKAPGAADARLQLHVTRPRSTSTRPPGTARSSTTPRPPATRTCGSGSARARATPARARTCQTSTNKGPTWKSGCWRTRTTGAGWEGSHYENVVFRVVPNAQTAAQLIQSGEGQFVPRTSPEIFESFKDSDAVTALDPPSFTNMFAMVNTGRPPLDDPSVRQALAYGIDLQACRRCSRARCSRRAACCHRGCSATSMTCRSTATTRRRPLSCWSKGLRAGWKEPEADAHVHHGRSDRNRCRAADEGKSRAAQRHGRPAAVAMAA